MEIKELYTFRQVRDKNGNPTDMLESRLVLRVGDREVAASRQMSADDYRLTGDKHGLYIYTVRELRLSIEREVSRCAFSPLN